MPTFDTRHERETTTSSRPPAARRQTSTEHKGCPRIALIFAASGRYGLRGQSVSTEPLAPPGSTES